MCGQWRHLWPPRAYPRRSRGQCCHCLRYAHTSPLSGCCGQVAWQKMSECTSCGSRSPMRLFRLLRLDVVQFLITECGASLQRDRFGLLPIHDAVENSHTEVRRYLQSQKLADPQQSLQKRRRVDSAETINVSAETGLIGPVGFYLLLTLLLIHLLFD